MEISGKSVNLFFANFLQENYNSTLLLLHNERWYSCILKCLQYWVKEFREVQDILLSVVNLLVYVLVQCYPWFKFYFLSFQTCLRDLESCLGKRANGRFKLRFSQNRICADKNTPNQFLWIKLMWNYEFWCRSNEQYHKNKGKLGYICCSPKSDFESLFHHTLPYPRTIGK